MNQKKKWPRCMAYVVAGICVAIFLWGFFLWEPAYQGRKLSFWFHEAADRPYLHEDEACVVAVRSMGATAAPYLARELRHQDSKLETFYRKQYDLRYATLRPAIQRLLPAPFRPRARQETAARLLAEIGAPAERAYPTMLTVYNRAYLKQHGLPADSQLDWIAQFTNAPAKLASPEEFGLRSPLLRGFAAIGGAHAQTIPLLLAAIHEPGVGWGQTIAEWTRAGTNLTPSIELAEPFLFTARGDSNLLVRYTAVTLLGTIATNHAEVIAPLMKSATNDADQEVRRRALESLAKSSVRLETILPLAGRALDDPNPAIRNVAARVVSKVAGGYANVFRALSDALDHPDPAVRAAAAKALGRYGSRAQSVAGKLSEHTSESGETDPQVRTECAAALAKITVPQGK